VSAGRDLDFEAHRRGRPTSGLAALQEAVEEARQLVAQPKRRDELETLLDEIDAALADRIARSPRAVPRR
jgi:hypothetical protein